MLLRKMKILVVQQKMIGDVLTSTIICEALKQQYPAAVIHYIANTSAIPVILYHPYIDKIIPFENSYRNSKRTLFNFLRNLKTENYDWVIDAYGKLESNLITIFSGAPQKTSYYKWYNSFLYNQTILRKSIAKSNAGLAIENRLRLVFEEDEIDKKVLKPKIYLTSNEIDTAQHYLSNSGITLNTPIIMLSVLGSSANKTMPFPFMAEVINTIHSELPEAVLLFNYIPNQKAEAEEIFKLCNASTQKQIKLEVYGKSLREFLAILHHCTFLIGNEGGAVNMAKALDIPTFTIFSPWIEKEGWNIFEGPRNVSVHLQDYMPELYLKAPKSYKKQAFSLYRKFLPELYFNKLKCFLLEETYPTD